MDQGHQDAGSAGAEGMAKGAGPPVHVQLVVGDAAARHGQHADHGKGLVHLEQIHLLHPPADPSQQLVDGPDGSAGELGRHGGMALIAHYPGQHRQPQPGGGLGPHQHQRRRTVRD
ncbi:hypothetical protein D3C85_1078700 [compost metagenome]